MGQNSVRGWTEANRAVARLISLSLVLALCIDPALAAALQPSPAGNPCFSRSGVLPLFKRQALNQPAESPLKPLGSPQAKAAMLEPEIQYTRFSSATQKFNYHMRRILRWSLRAALLFGLQGVASAARWLPKDHKLLIQSGDQWGKILHKLGYRGLWPNNGDFAQKAWDLVMKGQHRPFSRLQVTEKISLEPLRDYLPQASDHLTHGYLHPTVHNVVQQAITKTPAGDPHAWLKPQIEAMHPISLFQWVGAQWNLLWNHFHWVSGYTHALEITATAAILTAVATMVWKRYGRPRQLLGALMTKDEETISDEDIKNVITQVGDSQLLARLLEKEANRALQAITGSRRQSSPQVRRITSALTAIAFVSLGGSAIWAWIHGTSDQPALSAFVGLPLFSLFIPRPFAPVPLRAAIYDRRNYERLLLVLRVANMAAENGAPVSPALRESMSAALLKNLTAPATATPTSWIPKVVSVVDDQTIVNFVRHETDRTVLELESPNLRPSQDPFAVRVGAENNLSSLLLILKTLLNKVFSVPAASLHEELDQYLASLSLCDAAVGNQSASHERIIQGDQGTEISPVLPSDAPDEKANAVVDTIPVPQTSVDPGPVAPDPTALASGVANHTAIKAYVPAYIPVEDQYTAWEKLSTKDQKRRHHKKTHFEKRFPTLEIGGGDRLGLVSRTKIPLRPGPVSNRALAPPVPTSSPAPSTRNAFLKSLVPESLAEVVVEQLTLSASPPADASLGIATAKTPNQEQIPIVTTIPEMPQVGETPSRRSYITVENRHPIWHEHSTGKKNRQRRKKTHFEDKKLPKIKYAEDGRLGQISREKINVRAQSPVHSNTAIRRAGVTLRPKKTGDPIPSLSSSLPIQPSKEVSRQEDVRNKPALVSQGYQVREVVSIPTIIPAEDRHTAWEKQSVQNQRRRYNKKTRFEDQQESRLENSDDQRLGRTTREKMRVRVQLEPQVRSRVSVRSVIAAPSVEPAQTPPVNAIDLVHTTLAVIGKSLLPENLATPIDPPLNPVLSEEISAPPIGTAGKIPVTETMPAKQEETSQTPIFQDVPRVEPAPATTPTADQSDSMVSLPEPLPALPAVPAAPTAAAASVSEPVSAKTLIENLTSEIESARENPTPEALELLDVAIKFLNDRVSQGEDIPGVGDVIRQYTLLREYLEKTSAKPVPPTTKSWLSTHRLFLAIFAIALVGSSISPYLFWTPILHTVSSLGHATAATVNTSWDSIKKHLFSSLFAGAFLLYVAKILISYFRAPGLVKPGDKNPLVDPRFTTSQSDAVAALTEFEGYVAARLQIISSIPGVERRIDKKQQLIAEYWDLIGKLSQGKKLADINPKAEAIAKSIFTTLDTYRAARSQSVGAAESTHEATVPPSPSPTTVTAPLPSRSIVKGTSVLEETERKLREFDGLLDVQQQTGKAFYSLSDMQNQFNALGDWGRQAARSYPKSTESLQRQFDELGIKGNLAVPDLTRINGTRVLSELPRIDLTGAAATIPDPVPERSAATQMHKTAQTFPTSEELHEQLNLFENRIVEREKLQPAGPGENLPLPDDLKADYDALGMIVGQAMRFIPYASARSLQTRLAALGQQAGFTVPLLSPTPLVRTDHENRRAEVKPGLNPTLPEKPLSALDATLAILIDRADALLGSQDTSDDEITKYLKLVHNAEFIHQRQFEADKVNYRKLHNRLHRLRESQKRTVNSSDDDPPSGAPAAEATTPSRSIGWNSLPQALRRLKINGGSLSAFVFIPAAGNPGFQEALPTLVFLAGSAILVVLWDKFGRGSSSRQRRESLLSPSVSRPPRGSLAQSVLAFFILLTAIATLGELTHVLSVHRFLDSFYGNFTELIHHWRSVNVDASKADRIRQAGIPLLALWGARTGRLPNVFGFQGRPRAAIWSDPAVVTIVGLTIRGTVICAVCGVFAVLMVVFPLSTFVAVGVSGLSGGILLLRRVEKATNLTAPNPSGKQLEKAA